MAAAGIASRKDIGCDVPAENIDRAVAYIRSLHCENGGGFGYMGNHGATVTRAGTELSHLKSAANIGLTRQWPPLK